MFIFGKIIFDVFPPTDELQKLYCRETTFIAEKLQKNSAT